MKQTKLISVLVLSTFLAYSLSAAHDTLTYEQALSKLKQYDYEKSRIPLYVIENHMRNIAKDTKQKEHLTNAFVEILTANETSFAAKQFICEQLQWVGTDKQVPLLAKMLQNPETFEISRRTLQSIPSQKAREVLQQAIGQFEGKQLIAIINALGKSRDERLTEKLSELLKNSNQQVAIASARALGRLTCPKAITSLSQAKTNAAEPVKTAIIESLIQCANRCADQKRIKEANAIFQELYKPHESTRLRMAGLSGLVKIHKEKALPQIIEALTSEDYFLQSLAIKLIQQMSGGNVTRVMVEHLEKVSPQIRRHLIRALGERRDVAARSAIERFVLSQDLSTRLAAIEAIGALGDYSSVELLASIAAGVHGAGSEAAQQSLKKLTDPKVDSAILAGAQNSSPQIQAVLITALADRQVTEAVKLVIETSCHSNSKVRIASQNALAVLAQPQDYDKLIELLKTIKPDERKNLEKTITTIGKKMDNSDNRIKPLKRALGNANPDFKISILRILGDSNLPEAVKIIRTYIDDSNPQIRDAAIRTLADCSSQAAADDLFKLASDSDDTTYRTLALRGYVRLAKQAGNKSQGLSIEMFRKVIPLAKTTEDMTGILSGLAEATNAEALKLASSFMEHQEVGHEAALAMLKISKNVLKKNPAAVKSAMKRILALSRDKEVNKQARQLLQKTKGR